MHRVPPETVRTARLLLRRPTRADAPAMFDGWAQDAEAVRYLAWSPHTTVADSEAHLARCEAAWGLADGGAFRVWATCHTANVQSARVLEKAGFTLEGTLRRWGMNPNVSSEPCDHRCYGRVRERAGFVEARTGQTGEEVRYVHDPAPR